MTTNVRENIRRLRNERFSGHIVWKETTAACGDKTEHHLGGHRICKKIGYPHLASERNQLIGDTLFKEGLLGRFDTSLIIKSLYDEGLRRYDLLNSTATPEHPLPPMEPTWADGVHLNCWVNQELNRALVAQFFPPV
jgi:hypothetical protein